MYTYQTEETSISSSEVSPCQSYRRQRAVKSCIVRSILISYKTTANISPGPRFFILKKKKKNRRKANPTNILRQQPTKQQLKPLHPGCDSLCSPT